MNVILDIIIKYIHVRPKNKKQIYAILTRKEKLEDGPITKKQIKKNATTVKLK